MAIRTLRDEQLERVAGGDDMSDFMQRDRFNRAYHGLPGAFGDAPYFPGGANFYDRREISPTQAEGLRALVDGPGGGQANPLHPQSIDGIRGMLDAYERGQRGEPDPLWPDGGSETLQEMWRRMPPAQPENPNIGSLQDQSPTALAQGPTDNGTSQLASYSSDNYGDSYAGNEYGGSDLSGGTQLANNEPSYEPTYEPSYDTEFA